MISLSGSVLQIIFGAALGIYQLTIYQKQRKIALFLYISKCFFCIVYKYTSVNEF